jgi:hypothetical protein
MTTLDLVFIELLEQCDDLSQPGFMGVPEHGSEGEPKGMKRLEVGVIKNKSLRYVQLRTVWNSLLGKTSTKRRDIYAILANMLGFDAEEIMELPVARRMKALIGAITACLSTFSSTPLQDLGGMKRLGGLCSRMIGIAGCLSFRGGVTVLHGRGREACENHRTRRDY